MSIPAAEDRGVDADNPRTALLESLLMTSSTFLRKDNFLCPFQPACFITNKDRREPHVSSRTVEEENETL
ncbi:hypothetical protein J6590_082230 [Homalodisca vitripennis]|nr:hypothetical protein J6590_082230 [Homalodisca vitripennis]